MDQLTHDERERLNDKWIPALLGHGRTLAQRDEAFALAMDEIIAEYKRFLVVPQDKRHGENVAFFHEWINYTYAFNDCDLRAHYASRVGLEMFTEPAVRSRKSVAGQLTI